MLKNRMHIQLTPDQRELLKLLAILLLPLLVLNWLVEDKVTFSFVLAIWLALGIFYLFYRLLVLQERLANIQSALTGTDQTNQNPFPRPALLMRYDFQFTIDLPQLCRYLQLTAEEKESVKQWEPLPKKIIWQRWSGGYERLDIKYEQRALPESLWDKQGSPEYAEWETVLGNFYNVPVTQQLHNQTYEAFDCDGKSLCWPGLLNPAWMGILDNKSGGVCRLDITKESIRLYAIGGRFGVIWEGGRPPAPWEGMKEAKPRPDSIIFEVPLSQAYRCGIYSDESNERGAKWWLSFHDHRPVVTGRIDEVSADSSVVSFAYGFPKTTVKHWVKDINSFAIGDKASAVFDEDGRITDLWK